jgi:polysaccharide biosynthesis/export protein
MVKDGSSGCNEVVTEMRKLGRFRKCFNVGLSLMVAFVLGACASGDSLPPAMGYGSLTASPEAYEYLIGPGDQVQIFVWRNPEVSQAVIVRPDGKITTPLVEDLQASGKTPSELARDLEKALETYIRQPIVTVMVAGGIGPYTEQIRVVGQVGGPRTGPGARGGSVGSALAIAYRRQMTLLDVMVEVGGLSEFAAGNRTRLVRMVDGELKEYTVRLNDLLNGDITANVDMLPGDILIIPETWF